MSSKWQSWCLKYLNIMSPSKRWRTIIIEVWVEELDWQLVWNFLSLSFFFFFARLRVTNFWWSSWNLEFIAMAWKKTNFNAFSTSNYFQLLQWNCFAPLLTIRMICNFLHNLTATNCRQFFVPLSKRKECNFTWK